MAGLAQYHQIIEVVGATLAERQDVVDFLGWGNPAFFLALLTQRMFGNIAGTNLAPLPSIPAVDLRVALIAPVVVFGEFGVLITVPAVREARASGMRAGRFRLAWHHCLPVATAKPREEFCPLGALIYF